MIEARIDKENENDHVEARGTLLEITGEIGFIIAELYSSLLEEDPEAAELFKMNVINAVAGEGSPVWIA